MTCMHETVRCLNEYELIRKYHCEACDEIMMCACDQEIGETFLSHQLDVGCELKTQERLPVTLGFVQNVCSECRGLPPKAYPVAAIPGRTSKIKRYYWREIQFEEYRRFFTRASAIGLDPRELFSPEAATLREEIEKEVVEYIKQLHETNPKYVYEELSQAEVLARYNVEQVNLNATFAPKTNRKGVGIIKDGQIVSAEEFAADHYQRSGWKTIFTESIPFHVLFGVYMWQLVQDNRDPKSRLVSFGSRIDFDGNMAGVQIHTFLPEDFGSSGYAERRTDAVDKHLNDLSDGDLGGLFDYWLHHSADLREYLWAHQEKDVQSARTLVDVLPSDVIISILRYLVGDYWGRFIGWPDLFIYNDDTFFFAEVKASKDKLSEAQKDWIANNEAILQLPFKLIKIHRVATQSSPSTI